MSGDQARVTVAIPASREDTFRYFTEEIDQWWRRGRRFRLGDERGFIRLEPGVGGRLFESFTTKAGEKVVQTGEVIVWDPPARLVLRWRNVNFRGDEATEVEVEFRAQRSSTLVTVTHRGWAGIRDDHPARHGHDVGPFLAELGRWWGDLMTSLRHHAKDAAGSVRSA